MSEGPAELEHARRRTFARGIIARKETGARLAHNRCRSQVGEDIQMKMRVSLWSFLGRAKWQAHWKQR